MGHFRALKPLQASSLGLVRAGQDFYWNGNIIGWHVEPLDDEARRMVQERAEALRAKGIDKIAEEGDLPKSPFPQSIMKLGRGSGMATPAALANTMATRIGSDAVESPEREAPPRRRRAGGGE